MELFEQIDLGNGKVFGEEGFTRVKIQLDPFSGPSVQISNPNLCHASPQPYGGNPHGVRVKPLDFDAPGAPTIKTYHGISIVVNGRIIGRIHSWNPQMYTRSGSLIYELNHLTFGRPVDYVPSINSGYTISFTRTEVWNQEIEIALGYPGVWADLIDQNRPFAIQEYLLRGNVVYRVWSYSGCWFTNRNEEQMQDQPEAPRIMVNGELAFVSRIQTV